MRSIIYLTVVALATICHAQMDQKGANEFVDQILYALTHNKDAKIDPLHIAPFHKDIDEHLGQIPIKGRISMNNTEVDGLSRLHRLGNAVLKNENGSIVAELGLEDRNMKFFSDLHIDIGEIIHPNLNLEVDIGAIDVELAIAIGGSNKIQLKNFVVDNMDDVDIQVHGLSILDPLIDLIGDAYFELFNQNACEQITKLVRPLLENAIKNITQTTVDELLANYQQRFVRLV